MLLTEAAPGAPSRHAVNVDEFDRMAHAGVFLPDARVELVNGELVEMSPIGVPHDFAVMQLDLLLKRQLDGRAVVRVQTSLRCGDWSQPEPDIALVRWPPQRYFDRRPTTDDALLLIEVADSSLQFDQKVKVPLYASLEVPEVWVVNLPQRRVHVYTEPGDGGYATETVRTSKDSLVLTAFPDVEIPLRELGLDRPR
jgi:Uma2 family endonuclease